MQSAALEGEVQQKDRNGVWRTVYRPVRYETPVFDDLMRERMQEYLNEQMRHYTKASYVPGRTGAYMPGYGDDLRKYMKFTSS